MDGYKPCQGGGSMRLQGKFALITGGSEGIGLAIAQAFAREGATLCLVGRSSEKLALAQQQLGETAAILIPADLTTDQGIDTVVAQVATAGRALDVLVNNAAVATLAAFEHVTMEQYQSTMALNVTAPFFLTQRLLPRLAPHGSSIINISSYFAQKMIMNRPLSIYALSKGGLNSLTKALAFELGPRGIRVNAIAPGTVDTPMRRQSVAAMSQEHQTALQRYVEQSYPLGRIGQASDISGMAVLLASDEGRWITGGIFAVDGGLTAG
jgi:NAD(P)-dependent dehydrogenase (short-subunit alcohol dehydrogenase family)